MENSINLSENKDFLSSGDGSKFMESLKEDKNTGKEFIESLKEDKNTSRDFMESLKEKDVSIDHPETPDSNTPFWERYGLVENPDKNEIKEYHEQDTTFEISKVPVSDTPPWKQEPPVEDLCMRNKHLEGKKHPETDVPFVKKTVTDSNGNSFEGVFPVFDSLFDVQLPEKLYKAKDADQEKECNEKLKEAVKNDPELAKKFTPEQLKDIENGETPEGYTWHHNEETGKMQLVDSYIHSKTGHTGGKPIWGGGKENR